jgi:hypothetical protein
LKEYGMESHNTTVIDKPVEASETNRLISSEKVDRDRIDQYWVRPL